LKTGRTHQIRVHLADAGHAIAGDPKYGDFALNRRLARGTLLSGLRFERMFLHARRLRFVHPASGRPIELEAALPSECTGLLGVLAAAPR
jgi:23S rRNA pseudouridine955/2504/2580 synthase